MNDPAPARPPQDGSGVPVVTAAGLDIGYGHRAVVRGIDLTLAPGRVLALVGSNGSGKSTLLKTLMGLLPPLGGDLTVLGRSGGGRPGRRDAGRVGYLGQYHVEGGALPLRAVDLVRTGRFARRGLWGRLDRDDRRAIARSLERVGMTARADAPVRALSGGQRRRVHLARVLATEADLLLLDEPTAGLDAPGHERYAAAVADEVARGASVVVATHDIAEAARADQVMLLAGRVVAHGPPAEVLVPDHLLETFGIVLRTVEGAVLRTGDDHGHDHGPGHDHDHG